MKKTFKILSAFITVQIFIMIFIGAFISLTFVSFGQTTTSTTTAATSTPVTFEITGGFASNVIKEEKSQSSFGTETYKATITWSTNVDSDSHVVASYNLIGDYLLPPFENGDSNLFTKNHSVDLKGLSLGKNYYYYVYSKDANGNTITTDHGDWIKSHSFTTPGGSDGTSIGGGIGDGTGTGDASGGTGGTGGTTPPPFKMTPLPQINLQIGGTAPIVTGDQGVSILTIFKYAMGFIGLIALGAVIYGGILRITAAANPSNIKEGNDYILGAIMGIALLAGAAIIFNTINPQISNIGATETYLNTIPVAPTSTFNLGGLFSSPSSTSPYATSTYTFCGFIKSCVSSPNIIDPTPATEADARAYLKFHGVGGTDINQRPVCTDTQTTGCINFAGMKGTTLTTLAILSDEIGGVYITSGTEPGHATGQFSHANGYKFDLRMDDAVGNYVDRFLTPIEIRSDGAAQYKEIMDGVSIIFAKESSATGGPHWDVLVTPSP